MNHRRRCGEWQLASVRKFGPVVAPRAFTATELVVHAEILGDPPLLQPNTKGLSP